MIICLKQSDKSIVQHLYALNQLLLITLFRQDFRIHLEETDIETIQSSVIIIINPQLLV